MADVYFAYGKALLENAIAQSSVLGKEQTEEGPDGTEGEWLAQAPSDAREFPADVGATCVAAEDAAAKKGAILSFSGDAEDVEDAAVDLFAEASRAVAEEEREDEEEEGEEGAEPEDDFNAAWEVLDLARTIYDRQKDEDEEVRLKLADTYITLGDVSLETGALQLESCSSSSNTNILTTRHHREIRTSHHGLHCCTLPQNRPPPTLLASNRGGTLQA